MPHQCTNCGHVFEDGSKEMLSGCPDCGGNKFQYHPGDVPDEPADEAEPPEADTGKVSGAVGRAANKVRDAVTSDPSPSRTESSSSAGAGDGAQTSSSADGAADTTRSSPQADDAADGTQSSVDEGAGETTAPETGGLGDAGSDSSDDAEPASTASADPAAESAGGPESTRGPGEQSGSSDTPTSPENGAAGPETGASPEDASAGETVDATAAESEDSAQASARTDVVDTASLPDAAESGRVVKEPDEEEDRPDLEDLRQELNDQFESIRIVAPGQYELNLMELYDRQEYIIALQEDGQYVIEVPDAWDDPEDADDE